MANYSVVTTLSFNKKKIKVKTKNYYEGFPWKLHRFLLNPILRCKKIRCYVLHNNKCLRNFDPSRWKNLHSRAYGFFSLLPLLWCWAKNEWMNESRVLMVDRRKSRGLWKSCTSSVLTIEIVNSSGRTSNIGFANPGFFLGSGTWREKARA